MKYFTPKLWADYNSSVRSVWKKADKQWGRNVKSYVRQLKKILPKLSRNARRFFGKVDLHDGELLLISMGDILTFLKKWIKVRTNFIEIKVLHSESLELYILSYSGIRNYKIEYSSCSPIYDERDPYILGDWGYDELTMTKDKWLKHEILFGSGATIILEFKHFSYKVRRFKSEKDELRAIKQITSCTM